MVERTLLGDEETVALLEGDAVSVDKKGQHFVSYRLCCSVARAVSALPSRNLLPSISDGECRVPFLSQP